MLFAVKFHMLRRKLLTKTYWLFSRPDAKMAEWYSYAIPHFAQYWTLVDLDFRI